MTDFGGIGGVIHGRALDPSDLFEAAVNRAMGDRLRSEAGKPTGWGETVLLGQRLWGSLANVGWRHENGDTAGYSFRAAGDLIAAVTGQGDYMDWYCSFNYGEADTEVAELLAAEGWRPDPNYYDEPSPFPTGRESAAEVRNG